MLDIKVDATIPKDFGLQYAQAQYALDAQVIKDSNFFCPVDDGLLQGSALIASKLGSGEVQWNKPYAHAQYWGLPNKALDKNINARMKWFEEAQNIWSADWIATYGDTLLGTSKIRSELFGGPA
jgi:hypothetical protein